MRRRWRATVSARRISSRRCTSAPAFPSPVSSNARSRACGIGLRTASAADVAVIEGAKKEGKLVIYTGVERSAAQNLINEFQKKYPFISAETVRASSSKLATRLDAEIEANRVGGDVFEFS